MKFKPIAKNGTDEDIRKILLLNYPGCSSVKEALERKTKEMKLSPPQDSCGAYSLGQSWGDAVRAIEAHLSNYDIDLMPQEKRFELARMPLSTIEEINSWKQGWLSVDTGEQV